MKHRLPNEGSCEEWVGWLMGDMTDDEMQSFVDHVRECRDCSIALSTYGELNMQLSLPLIRVEPPQSLKQKTLSMALSKRPDNHIKPSVPSWRHRLLRPIAAWQTMTITALAVVFGIVLGSHLGNLPLPATTLHSPYFIKQMEFRPGQFEPSASGQVMLVHHGKAVELIVLAHHLWSIPANCSYSVWTIHGKDHHLAGVLQLDAKGNGVLTALLPATSPFSAVGISYEPSRHDTKPKGPTVLKASISNL